MNGKLKDWSFSRTGESVLTITTRESCKKLWDVLGDQEITFSIKKRVTPRSLNANNYAWSLIEKLAVAVKSDKDSVYEEMLRRYGTGETYTDEAGNECKVLFSLREGVPPGLVARHYAETGVGYVEGKKFIHYRAIKGTSEYSTKEMSVFLDGIISECQEVGIETDTPPSRLPDTRRNGIREESLLRLLRPRDRICRQQGRLREKLRQNLSLPELHGLCRRT